MFGNRFIGFRLESAKALFWMSIYLVLLVKDPSETNGEPQRIARIADHHVKEFERRMNK